MDFELGTARTGDRAERTDTGDRERDGRTEGNLLEFEQKVTEGTKRNVNREICQIRENIKTAKRAQKRTRV